ncbi:hypothetical protein [Amphibacillus jilinensis]|uniref:hypothetical protein n=1 Tax=Amphibacillus jilinensis TaxID=1216008 RepID=UPI00030832A9|nr:hypothetical protein [Amphibacillus jilinensis]
MNLGFPQLSDYDVFTPLVILAFKDMLLQEKKINAPATETLTFLTSFTASLDLCSLFI